MDIVFIAAAVAFWAGVVALAVACDRLHGQRVMP